jgi:hypothetical protein
MLRNQFFDVIQLFQDAQALGCKPWFFHKRKHKCATVIVTAL